MPLILTLMLAQARPVTAQTPLSGLRLLAWSTDGTFLLGSTPGQAVTLPDNSIQQLQRIWRLPADGSTRQQLAGGLDPQLSPDGRLVVFSRLDAQNQAGLWGIDVATASLQPVDPSLLATPEVRVAGDPPGRVYVAPDGKQRAIVINEFATATLWIGADNAPAQLVLSAGSEVFSDLAWRSDSQALALIRTPLGNQIDTAGELWQVNLSDFSLIQLSRNNAVDRSPVWNAAGSSLAVVRNEQLVIVPANQLMVEEFRPVTSGPVSQPAPIKSMAQLIPPATIRVIHHASNTCRDVPVGQIDIIPFEEYVKRVVPYEVFPSWPAETLKAQAVAARTYGWDKYLQNPGGDYHVTDWINHQYMCDTTVPATDQAVDATTGEYLAYNGQMITAMFSAENSSPTKTNPNAAYLQAVDDPVSFGRTRNGHGYGMGQWGAQRWADRHHWSYQAILRHYYTNVTVEQAGATADTKAPNVALVRPWSNHYLTGNKLRILANTSDDSGQVVQTNIYLSTPGTTTLLASENGPASGDGYVVDISTWADQALIANTLVLTAEAFDAGGKRGVSLPVTIGLDRISPTGWLTTATTLVGSTLITDSPVLSLTLSASDTTAGVQYLALGRKAWEWAGESLTREQVNGQPAGQVVADSDALTGLAMQATVDGNPAGSWSSAEISLPAPLQYQANFRMKVGDNSIPAEVARLEVINTQNGAVIGLHRLHGPDFRTGEVYQEFHVNFDYPGLVCGSQGPPVTMRLTFQGTADIWLDRVTLAEYPTAFTTRPTYDQSNFRLKVIDGAGNISEDLLVIPATRFEYKVYLPLLLSACSASN